MKFAKTSNVGKKIISRIQSKKFKMQVMHPDGWKIIKVHPRFRNKDKIRIALRYKVL
jgi:hypothetical protein